MPVGAAALACAAMTALGASDAQASTPAWAATATKAVPTSSLIVASGPLAATAPMTVNVVLGLHNSALMRQDIASGVTMSHAAFMSQFAPTSAQVNAVKSYLQSEGLTPTAVTANNAIVTATGTASAVQSAFGTQLDSVTANGHSGYANLTAARVPSALSSTVVAVLGLNDIFSMSTGPTPSSSTSPASSCTLQGVGYVCSYNPKGFQKAYDAIGTPTGSATTEAIFAEGNLTGVVKDLRTEEAANPHAGRAGDDRPHGHRLQRHERRGRVGHGHPVLDGHGAERQAAHPV